MDNGFCYKNIWPPELRVGVLYSVVRCCTVCTVSSVQSAVAPRLARAGAGRAVGHFPQSAEVSVQSAQLFALLREQCYSAVSVTVPL